MRITFLGHAGLFVQTRHGSVLCDPWFTPAYFGSWFPFPRNDDLRVDGLASPDYLYISHLHRDHFEAAEVQAGEYCDGCAGIERKEVAWRKVPGSATSPNVPRSSSLASQCRHGVNPPGANRRKQTRDNRNGYQHGRRREE